MKKFTSLVLGLALLGGTSLKAQHDINANVLGAFFGNYGLGYEYVINDEMGAGISFNYATGFLGIDLDDVTDQTFSSFNIAPEFRFYFNPEDGADGFYFGGYMKYYTSTYGNMNYNLQTTTTNPNGTTTYTSKDVKYDRSYTGFAVGIETGRKWVTNSGFFFETMWGFGKFLGGSWDISNAEVKAKLDEDNYDFNADNPFAAWDMRLSIGIGWRLGGY